MTGDEISEACFTAMLGLFFHHSYFVLFCFFKTKLYMSYKCYMLFIFLTVLKLAI